MLGRAAQGDGNLGADPELSRDHARISRYVTGEIVIEDLGSTNGTFVNGWPIEQPTALIAGTVVAVGQSELQVLSPEHAVFEPTRERTPPSPRPSRLRHRPAPHRTASRSTG